MKIKYNANYGYARTDIEDIIKFPDNTTEEEIESTIHDIVMERIEWYWEEIN